MTATAPLASTVEEMRPVREVEAELAAPHTLRCFEIAAEEMVEAGVAEYGDWHEVTDNGMTVMARFRSERRTGTPACRCGEDDGWAADENDTQQD